MIVQTPIVAGPEQESVIQSKDLEHFGGRSGEEIGQCVCRLIMYRRKLPWMFIRSLIVAPAVDHALIFVDGD